MARSGSASARRVARSRNALRSAERPFARLCLARDLLIIAR